MITLNSKWKALVYLYVKVKTEMMIHFFKHQTNEAIDKIDVICIQISHNLLQRNSFVFFGGGKLTARRKAPPQ